MYEIAYTQLLILILQCVIVGSLLIFLFKLRSIFGLSLLFTALGVFQYLQSFLVAALYIEIIPGVVVSPGSMVLFTGSLFAILLIYIREDALEARKVIYALLTANLVLTALQFIFSWSISGQHVMNIYNLPEEFFILNSRMIFAGTLVLFIDAFIIIFIYETIARYIAPLFFRILFAMAVVVSIDSLLFALGAFAGTEMFSNILISGLVAKLLSTIIYAFIFWVYLAYIDNGYSKPKIKTKPFQDIFHALTYRQKYEQVSIEKINKSIELQKKEIQFRTLFESMAQGVTYQNAKGEIIDANPAAQRILGLTLKQMQGKTSRDKNWRAIHEDGSEFSGETHPGMVALKTGKEQNNVIMGVFNSSKKEYRWIKINASPQFRNSGKRPYQVFTTFDDVTIERRAQHSLNELYTKYQNIIHTANIAIFELDKDGKYIFVNSAWEALLGYKSNEVLGKDKELVLSRGESSPLLFNELKQGQITNYNQERRYHAKNGKIIWCDLYVAANKDLKGKLKSIVGVIVDITTKKETETKIREKERLVSEALAEVERSEKLLNETGRLAKVGGWELDLTTMTPYFSDETYRIHELPTGEPPKLEDGMGFYAPEFQPTVKRVVNEALENHTPYDVEVRFITAKGRSIWVRTFGRVELKNGKAIRLYGAIQDITELKESNLRLQESKTKYKDLVEYSYDLIWTIDATGTITFINQACKSIYGYEPEALIGQSFFDFVPKEQAEKDNAIFTKSMKEGEVIINYDSQFIHKDGHIVQLLTNARKLRDESGNFIGTSGISKDVTEQKRKEQELKASEKRFKTIVEGAPDPIFIQIDKRFAYLNKHAVELFGAVDEKELLGKPVLESFHPNFHKRALERIKSLNADKTNRQGPFEQLLIQLNGNQIWVETKGQPIIYNGENGGLVFVRDITSRKKAEKELRESKTLLENINNNLPGAVIKYKLFPNGKDELIYVSEGAKAIWGVNPETAMQDNLKIWEQIDEEYIAIVKHSIEVSFQTLDPWHVVFKNNRPDGAFNWIEATGMPQKQEDGSVIYNAILLDVTSRKELENEMLRYKESLQDLTTEMTLIEEKQRKEIAANIHDHLSQSLVISKMKLTDIAKEAHTNEKRKEINTIIGHISEALENTRKITYDLSPPILYELGLIEAVYWLSEKIENENQIKVRFKTELNEINLTEPNLILIYRAIQEILANAIKYSGAEEINIFFTTYDNGLKIVIRDEGSGFRKSALNAPKKSNTGFGLFAVKQRIENLRGTFIINSSIGKGTEVKMFVPIKPTKLL